MMSTAQGEDQSKPTAKVPNVVKKATPTMTTSTRDPNVAAAAAAPKATTTIPFWTRTGQPQLSSTGGSSLPRSMVVIGSDSVATTATTALRTSKRTSQSSFSSTHEQIMVPTQQQQGLRLPLSKAGKTQRGASSNLMVAASTSSHHASARTSSKPDRRRSGGTSFTRKKKSRTTSGGGSDNTTANLSYKNNKLNGSILLVDEDEERITNPLVDIPDCPANERLDSMELYMWANIVFGRPDTYPLSYYARLLGFDVPPLPPVITEDEEAGDHETATTRAAFPHVPFPDVATLPFAKEKNPTWNIIPPLGSFASKVWKSNEEDPDQLLDYMDPVYNTMKTKPFKLEYLKQVLLPSMPAKQRILDGACLQMARETILKSEYSNAEFATSDGTHSNLNHGEFGVWCGVSNVKEGKSDGNGYDKPSQRTFLMSYRLQWYQMENSDGPQTKTATGMHSATAYLQKVQRELVLFLHHLRRNVPKPIQKVPKVAIAVDDPSKKSRGRKKKAQGEDSLLDSSDSDGDDDRDGSRDDPQKEMHPKKVATDMSLEEPTRVRNSESMLNEENEEENIKSREQQEKFAPKTNLDIGTAQQLGRSKDEGASTTDEGKREDVIKQMEGEISKSQVAPESNQAMTPDEVSKRNEQPGSQKPPFQPKEPGDKTRATGAKEAQNQVVGDEDNRISTSSEKPKDVEDGDVPDAVFVTMVALMLEHARACDIYYGFVQVPKGMAAILKSIFRMTELNEEEKEDNSSDKETRESKKITLLFDLTTYSYKFAFLAFGKPKATTSMLFQKELKHRMLVRLPTMEQARTMMTMPSSQVCGTHQYMSAHLARMPHQVNRPAIVGNALSQMGKEFRVRVNTDDKSMHMLDKDGDVKSLETRTFTQTPKWDILRIRPLTIPSLPLAEGGEDDEVLQRLKEAQVELSALESGMKPKLRDLMAKTVDFRTSHEKEEEKRQNEAELVKEFRKLQARRKEIDAIWQQQRDQDMDAVCDICNDGEVTPDNQIIFCESCNVAVHQMCYGIDVVPEGDYYCVACRYFEREKMSEVMAKQAERGALVKVAPAPLPICCELCPRKQGAFIRSENKSTRGKKDSKWVHVLCAKWQGLAFVDNGKGEMVEDVSQLKLHFRYNDTKCVICLGNRGAFNSCRVPECNNQVHVTCARLSGLCEVVHGENCYGAVADNPWSLLCPDHSTIDPEVERIGNTGKMTVEQLQLAAGEFPPEPHVEPPKPTKPFNKLTGAERRKAMENPEYEAQLLQELSTRKAGVRCEVCYGSEDDGRILIRCTGCGVSFCEICSVQADHGGDVNKNYKCAVCQRKDKSTDNEEGRRMTEPSCSLCVQKGGWLRRAEARPVGRKTYWKTHPKEYQNTLFARPFWVHQICQMWQEKITIDAETATVDCDQVVMTHGRGFVRHKNRCLLCGEQKGMKMKCDVEGCRAFNERTVFHVTCARQAGFQVDSRLRDDEYYTFYVNCFRHSGNSFNLRAKLEDLIEIEKRRVGKSLELADSKTTTFSQCSRLLNAAIHVMQMLGWAWRWAEWWVESRDSWEPLLEPGQVEQDMTKEELRIVDSTPESRCADARKCRLVAFGAALRNREYDKEEKGDTVMIDRALRAVLHTKSLVGPLHQWEVDFFAEWLGLAYRSKSRLLGFGENKIPIRNVWYLLNQEDKSPKYELGNRRLPGKQELPAGQVFETDFVDSDDFLRPSLLADGTKAKVPVTLSKPVMSKSERKEKLTPDSTLGSSEVARASTTIQELVHTSSDIPPRPPPPKRKPGRPRKNSNNITTSIAIQVRPAAIPKKTGRKARKAGLPKRYIDGAESVKSVQVATQPPLQKTRRQQSDVEKHVTLDKETERSEQNINVSQPEEESSLQQRDDRRKRTRAAAPTTFFDENVSDSVEIGSNNVTPKRTRRARSAAPTKFLMEDDDEVDEDDEYVIQEEKKKKPRTEAIKENENHDFSRRLSRRRRQVPSSVGPSNSLPAPTESFGRQGRRRDWDRTGARKDWTASEKIPRDRLNEIAREMTEANQEDDIPLSFYASEEFEWDTQADEAESADVKLSTSPRRQARLRGKEEASQQFFWVSTRSV